MKQAAAKILILVVLTACTTPEERAAQVAQQQMLQAQHQEAILVRKQRIDNYCSSKGFKDGTAKHATCVAQVYDRMRQENEQRILQQQQTEYQHKQLELLERQTRAMENSGSTETVCNQFGQRITCKQQPQGQWYWQPGMGPP